MILKDAERIVILEHQIKQLTAVCEVLQKHATASGEALSKLQHNSLQLAKAFTQMQAAFDAISEPDEKAEQCH